MTSITECVVLFVVVSPIHFTAVSKLLMFEECRTEPRCQNISLNSTVKDKKTFNVTLMSENVPRGVEIDPAEAVVEIDQRSKYMNIQVL